MAPLSLQETWAAMEGLYASGQARAIGVRNFSTKKLQDLLLYAKIPPVVNQVECHPVWQQPGLQNLCNSTGVHLSAYSPLGSPGSWVKGEILKEPVLVEIAGKLNKTPAQVALRWGIQSRHSVLPKSINESRIKENLSLFDWSIPSELFSKFSGIHQGNTKLQMAPVPRTTIDHFLHKGHPLIELHAETEYHCDGCKTLGDGTRYRCNSCDFDLHKYCGTCPAILPSFMHTHSLNLVVRKPKETCLLDRFCDVCGGAVLGLFYRCKNCDFDVHPLCTQLPQHLRHALHQLHPLRLQEPFFGSSRCAVCGGACTRWCYGCGPCGFALHLECVLVALPQPQPPPPAHRAVQHSHGITYPYVNQGQGGGARGDSNGKMVSTLVTKLALGVLSNMVFGVPGMDFSSFL